MSPHLQQAYWISTGEEIEIRTREIRGFLHRWLVFEEHKMSEFGNCQRCGWRKMKYIALAVEVDAFEIERVEPAVVDENQRALALTVHLVDGPIRTLDAGMMARYTPVPGDYYVIQEDGYVYVNPKAVFERKYRKAEE